MTILTDAYVRVIVSSIQINKARCKNSLDLLEGESISGESSGRTSLYKSINSTKSSSTNV